MTNRLASTCSTILIAVCRQRRAVWLALALQLGLATHLAFAQANIQSTAKPGFFEKMARRVEPDLRGQVDRLPQYVEFFQNELANDVRLFAFNVNATQKQVNGTAAGAASDDAGGSAGPQEAALLLEGFVEFEEHRQAVAQFLTALGFSQIENRIERLPHPDLGELKYGLLTVAHSLSFDHPSGQRSVVTECLVGEPLFLLQQVGDYFLAHCGEGYLGYVAARDIHRVDGATFAEYQAGPRVWITSDATLAAGDALGRIPAGAVLKLKQAGDTQIQVELPDGRVTSIGREYCRWQPHPSTEMDQIIATAQDLIGTRYLWGGKTRSGVDCSGLVQVAFAAAGLNLPRDSNQQVYLGRLSATRWCPQTMQRGDTLYFLGDHGRIRHTALYLGDQQYVQAESPVARISSFDPQHPDYDPRRHRSFAFAKRLLD